MTRPVDDDSAAQARWSPEEITALVDYLHAHRSEGNGAGGFKSATFTGAVKHLEPFHVAGSKVKDVKSVKYKWGALKAILAIINRWHNTSGNHYDDINGAKGNGGIKEFRNKGWEHRAKMDEISHVGNVDGTASHRGTANQESSQSATPSSLMATPHGIDNPNTGLSQADQETIVNAADTISSVLHTLADLPPPSSDLSTTYSTSRPISSIASNSHSSQKKKRPVSSLSPGDQSGPHSSLFSAHPPVSSTPTATSVYSGRPSAKKRSRTSVPTNAGTKQPGVTTVALHAVDSSIRHLSDSISSSMLDPLVSVREATQLLYSQPAIPQEHRRFMLLQWLKQLSQCLQVFH
ncbi:hypothetical protein JVT61DRAFT_11202 [Boletus reticuloceps]|uniref:Myb/SANT-like domain-containing protein n=1 Tax=Boletus reticuloceps TaxID=495285 RepID=A0A8I2YEM4_9AGAM|nr:hypothetical protein JVT61DRAFT_11202 [Boletus reticuloceps]